MCLGEQNNDGLGVKLPLTMSSRDVLDDDRSLNKAAVEHGVAKELIAQLQSMMFSIPCLMQPSLCWVSMSTTT
jgi:hypothetical protein